MVRKVKETSPPRRITRWLARLPIILYRARLGWLLGRRFLLLTHTGRKSGLPRKVVLEVIRHDESSDTYFVVSGWGEKSNWYRNICKTPEVGVVTGRHRLRAVATTLSPEEAEREMLSYSRRYPRAARNVPRLMGYRVDGTEADFRELARLIPFVALKSSAKL